MMPQFTDAGSDFIRGQFHFGELENSRGKQASPLG